MRDASTRLDVAADNVASASTEKFTPEAVISSELVSGEVQTEVTLGVLKDMNVGAELVAAMVAKAAFTANARVFEQSARLDRSLLDLRA